MAVEYSAIEELLQAVAAGNVSPASALEHLQGYRAIGDFAKIDEERADRTGFPEVIFGLGKTPEQIIQIMQTMVVGGASRNGNRQPVVMATRITPEVQSLLAAAIPELHYYPEARISALHPQDLPILYPGKITILTAGTADVPVASEAAVTAQLCGFRVEKLWDVGVAGIQRLLNNRQVLAEADVLIVVAGMEGALPSVVAGLADCPTIAVPTSVGYGAHLQGLAPLLTMINSCAAGVAVVNIDNGFGAAILAGQILRTAGRLATRERAKDGKM
jgi:pyridinium-3,5-biscarboxylic acid mononucleotide synthase